MKKGEWTFLSNHGRVLIYLFNNPKSTTEKISRETELSQRGVQKIITELETAGYIAHKKEGRRNHYTVHSELPMRHHLEHEHTVGEIIRALADSPKERTTGSYNRK